MNFDTAADTEIVAEPLPFTKAVKPVREFQQQQQQQQQYVNIELEDLRRRQAQSLALQQ